MYILGTGKGEMGAVGSLGKQNKVPSFNPHVACHLYLICTFRALV